MEKIAQPKPSSKSCCSAIIEASSNFCLQMFPYEDFLASKNNSLREIEVELESSQGNQQKPICSRNPYLYKDCFLFNSLEALRDKVIELC